MGHNSATYDLPGRAPATFLTHKIIKDIVSFIAILSLLGLSLVIAGCGGSSGGGLSSQVVSGVAAAGAPLSGTVSIKDSSSPAKVKTTGIGSDGAFAFDVTDMKAPFVLQANGSSGGTNNQLHSYATGAGTANANPLSNMIVAAAAGVADPATVFNNPDPVVMQTIGDNLSATVAAVQQKLQPLLALFGAESVNPVTGAYLANHLGLDGMFDKVSFSLSGGGFTVTNTQSGAVICTGNMSAIAGGVFTSANMPAPATPPAAPASLSAVGAAGQATLTWSAVSGATAYNLYYGTSPGITTAATKIVNVSSPYLHSGLAAGTYYYIITAQNGAGESAPSPEVKVVVPSTQPVPATPSNLQATGGTNQITLSWSAVSGATSYNIYYSTTAGVTVANGTKISNAVSPAVQSGLVAGTAYYYIVTAVNSAGESPASAQVTATPLAAVSIPAAPSGVTATGGAGQVTISWQAVAGATSYNLYYRTTTGVTTANGTRIANVTSPYAHASLVAGTTYFYVVTAVNGAGESVASAQVSAATTAALDGAVLYAANCAGCHNALASSSKRKRTATQIQNAITNDVGGMGYLSTLSAAEVQAIATALNF